MSPLLAIASLSRFAERPEGDGWAKLMVRAAAVMGRHHQARDICITVGEWEALLAASGRVGNARRMTRLVELIRGEK